LVSAGAGRREPEAKTPPFRSTTHFEERGLAHV
jgi:hypothetical protein